MHQRRGVALALAGVVTLSTIGVGSAYAATGRGARQSRVVDRPIATSGCHRTPPATPGTSTTETVESGGIERHYVLHVPGDYDPAQAMPLIIAFHGRGSSGAELEDFSGLSALDAIVAYPDGLPTTGRNSWEGAPYAPASDDVLFVSDLLNSLQSNWCVDPAQIDATGKSNGGGFTALLACRLPHRIAAFAPVAGAYYPQSQVGCDHTRPVPVVEFHGTADPTMDYGGGISHGTAYPSVPDWLQTWVDKDHCTLTNRQSLGTDVVEESWHGCADGTDVVHYKIIGAGHTWPGELSDSGPGAATQTISASQVMWDFFQQHRLPHSR